MVIRAIVLAAVVGGSIALVLQSLNGRRDSSRQEQQAARVMYVEISAAIDALDMVLAGSDFRWLPSLSESGTLADAWQEHWEGLGLRPGLEHWRVLQDAVVAVSPGHGFVWVSGRDDHLRRTLSQRRECLVDGAEILRALMHGPRTTRAARLNKVARARKVRTRACAAR